MRAAFLMEITHSGGWSEPDMKALTVMPRTSGPSGPSAAVVTTVTPLANDPITLRNSRGSIAGTASPATSGSTSVFTGALATSCTCGSPQTTPTPLRLKPAAGESQHFGALLPAC